MKRLLLLISISAWAQGLDRPIVGFVRDAAGAWHAVEGIGGAFVVGPATNEDQSFAGVSRLTLERRENGFYVVDGEGSTIDILPPNATYAELLSRGPLYATEDELVYGGVRFALAGVTGLRAMSAEFVQVSTFDGEYLLRVEMGREALFRLPALNPAEAAQ